MKQKSLWFGIGLLIVVAVILGVSFSNGRNNGSSATDLRSPPLPTSGTFDPTTKDWQQNGTDNVYVTQLFEGELNTSAAGVVKSDTDCEADKEGISHCHNEVALEGGKTITVISIHNMQKHSCFSPGDKVKAEPLISGWVQLTKV